MAKKLYEEEDIRDIACAIREKCGDETAKYKCCDICYSEIWSPHLISDFLHLIVH